MYVNKIEKYKKLLETNKKEMGMFLILCSLLFIQVLRIGEYPGLYMDAIMSDYAAVRYINQQPYSHSYFRIVGDLQLTGALYHGNLTMLWTLLICLFTGTTSVLQYRLGTTIWCVLILACIQYIMTKWNILCYVKYSIMLALVLAPSFVTTIFTQYYAFLPGTLFVLISYILWEKWCEKRENKKVFQVAFWLGLAIYSYFVYAIYALLFLAMFCYVIVKEKSYKSGVLFTFVSGMFAGVFLYIVGFYSMGIAALSISSYTKIGILSLLIVFMLVVCWWAYRLSIGKSNSIKKIVVVCIMVSIGIAMVLLLNRIPTVIAVLKTKFVSASGKNALGLIDKVVTVLHHISAFMRDSKREYIILGYTTSKVSALWRDSYFVCLVVWTILNLMRKIKTKEKIGNFGKINLVLIFLQVGYATISIPISGGLCPHHYTTFYVISYLSMAVMLHDLLSMCKSTKKFKYIKKIIIIWSIAVICMNFVNGGILATHINRTGGHNYYTHQTTELANRAIDMQSNGVKQFYILPEWGFVNSFEYLTGNTIPFTADLVDSQYINNRIGQGFTTFILVYKDRNQVEKYKNVFGENYVEMLKEEIWYSLDGEYAFTTLELDLSK